MNKRSLILIVDDLKMGRDTLEAVLTGQGYDLAFASDGLEALTLATQLLPDIILLDVMMPVMDGYEVCRRLRQNSAVAEVPIILLTALDDKESRLTGIEAGADDFISKPYDRVELRARLRTITRLNRYRLLNQAQAKFNWVLEHAEDGYLTMDSKGGINYANAQARRILGLPILEGAPISDSFLELVAKHYELRPPEAWQNLTPESLPEHKIRYLVRPDKASAEKLWLRVDYTEMDPNLPDRYLIQLRDVTASLHDQTVQWSFEAMIRHKLNTPILHLSGSLELLTNEKHSLDEESRQETISIAHKATERLKSHVHDILKYMAAIKYSRTRTECCPLSVIPSMLNEICLRLELPAPRLDYGEIPADKRAIPLNSKLVDLILSELLENARKFHPRHKPEVEVIIGGDKDRITLRVIDDGITLPPEILAKIWTPYYQGERFFTGEVPGMGLGLPTIAILIWGIGGTCRIFNKESGPGIVSELEFPVAL